MDDQLKESLHKVGAGTDTTELTDAAALNSEDGQSALGHRLPVFVYFSAVKNFYSPKPLCCKDHGDDDKLQRIFTSEKAASLQGFFDRSVFFLSL
jgi:hypothetical protein